MKISIIVAYDDDRVIGVDNSLCYKISEDMNFSNT